MSTVATTVRWDTTELADIKAAAKRVGLPVSLFVKSIALSRALGEGYTEGLEQKSNPTG